MNTRQTPYRNAKLAGHRLSSRGGHEPAELIYSYHAALEDERRQLLEPALQTGHAHSVWSTTAIEIGM